ncbi:UbiA prenyltransferase family protein [Moritella sp. PE36]|uniref:prenyltransferase n=1 Tax=Moritella sp. PE36 TaxID=58051 RepID=UPI0001568198|nr:prenyltransferase [Moritella sp. PE36]EDM67194.1 UbiA prenyltransferase family protein [Moritella sp. PE36]
MLAFRFKAVLQTINLSYLLLTIVCIFLGFSAVIANHGDVNGYLLIAACIAAFVGHFSLCTFHEYSDLKHTWAFKVNRDKHVGHPRARDQVNSAFLAGLVALIVSLLCGLFLVVKFGLGILPVGVIGLMILLSYSSVIKKHPIYSLLAPGFGFALLIALGTEYVLVGQYTQLVWVIAIIPFFLVNNLWLLNNYGDIKASADDNDSEDFPMAYGIKVSNYVYAVFATLATLIIITYVVIGYLPVLSLIALIPMPLAFYALYGGIKFGQNITQQPKFLRSNLIATVATPALLGLTLILD